MIHLSTMGILRGHFHKSQILQAWKLFSMMCLLVMMCIAIFPTSSYRSSSSAMVSGTPCLDWQPCDFRWWNDTVASLWDWAKVENPRKELAPQGVLSYMVLISAHLWQAVLLYKPAHDQFRIFFHRPLRLAKKLLATKYCLSQDHRKRYHALIYRLIFGVYLFTFAILNYLDLMLSRYSSYFSGLSGPLSSCFIQGTTPFPLACERSWVLGVLDKSCLCFYCWRQYIV